MKSIRIVGLSIMAAFAMSIIAAGNASAVEIVWEHCTEENVFAIPTKYATTQCRTAETSGASAWRTVEGAGTEKGEGFGSLVLEDTKVPIEGTVEVQCTVESRETIGPKDLGQISTISVAACKAGPGCEKIEGTPKPLNLPWRTEIRDTGEENRGLIKAANGKGAGWAVTCRVLGVMSTDECTTEEGSTKIVNKPTPGRLGELLVLATFDGVSPNPSCTVGGTHAGEIRGPVGLLQSLGRGLRFS